MESPRPPPLVARLRKASCAEGLEIADVVRCRRSALLRNVHPLPVFCPLDDIKVRTGPLLGDINFVTKSPKSFASSLGYCGPGWQHRVQTEWLLHTGVIAWKILVVFDCDSASSSRFACGAFGADGEGVGR